MTAPVPAATDDQSPSPQDTPAPESTDASAEAVAVEVEAETAQAADAPVADTPVVEAPVKAIPDRADAPVSEVTERFLRAVIASVPIELIEELHLFSPLRQGTVETGIAVLAARVPMAAVEENAGEPELPFVADGATTEAVTGTTEALEAEAPEAENGDTETPVEVVDVEVTQVVADVEDVSVVAAEGDDDEDVSVVQEVLDEVIIEASADETDEAEALVDVPQVKAARPVRHTVYTARYRYVIKGPERGKWESNIKAEADAPLITVETVVRGVQRRAGEESEIVRYSGAQIARALRIPYTA